MAISGNVTTADGRAADWVRIFRWPDKVLEAVVAPSPNGDWTASVTTTGEYGITYLAAGCQPVTHGPYYFESDVSLWTPDLILTAIWLDADDANTITLDVGVSVWADKSGNGRDAIQNTAASQPTLGELNGKTILSFDGANDYLETYDSWAGNPNGVSVFMVYKLRSYTVNYPIALNKGGVNAEWQVVNASLAAGNDPGKIVWRNIISLQVRSGTVYPLQSWVIFGGTMDSNGLRQFWNGLSEGQHPSTAYSLSSNSTLEIGGASNGGFPLDGEIAEVIVIDNEISDSDRQKIEGYLAHKWDLAGSLPVDHPHKESAPTQ